MTSVLRPAPTAGTVAAVAGAVAEEIDELGKLTDDRGLVARLNTVEALLRWMRTSLTTDGARLANVEAELGTALASGGPVVDGVHRVLAARGIGAAEPPAETALSAQPATGPRPPGVAEVSAYLGARHPGDRAHEVRTLTGGFSKVTLLVRATLDGVKQDIVIRQVPAGRSAKSLEPEFGVLSFVHAHGLPAPRPMWLEHPGGALGGGFFVMARAVGRNVGDVWGQDGASREVCLEIAELYARLHQLPVGEVRGPISPRSTPAELHAMIDWQIDVLGKRGIGVEPVLAALLGWLRSNIPAEPPRKSLIHGDAAFSNLLVDGSRVTAILDWEAAHVGDAADELAYLRPSIEPVVPWQDFLTRYVEAGGLAPTPEAMKFFEVWSHVWRYIGCLWLSQNFTRTGRYPSAVAAFVHAPKFLEAAVDAAFS